MTSPCATSPRDNDQAIDAPIEVLEWIWHMDLHLTEHDERHARPMPIEAARWLIQQCQLASKPVFVKQDNGPRPGMQGRFTDEEWALKEYPA